MSSTEAQLDKLFDPSDTTSFLKKVYWNGETSLVRVDKSEAEYFCINPLKSTDTHRTDNLKKLQNFLFEFDKVDLEVQLGKLRELKTIHHLPIASIVYSGGKSYHAIIALQAPLTEIVNETNLLTYKAYWHSLAKFILDKTGLEADTACSKPAQLSRLAGATRTDNGATQELIELGDYISTDELQAISSNYSIEFKLKKNTEAVPRQPTIHQLIFNNSVITSHRGIVSSILKTKWSPNAGNHAELFRIANWVSDATGGSFENVVGFLEFAIWPKLKELNYPYENFNNVLNRLKSYKY